MCRYYTHSYKNQNYIFIFSYHTHYYFLPNIYTILPITHHYIYILLLYIYQLTIKYTTILEYISYIHNYYLLTYTENRTHLSIHLFHPTIVFIHNTLTFIQYILYLPITTLSLLLHHYYFIITTSSYSEHTICICTYIYTYNHTYNHTQSYIQSLVLITTHIFI